MNKKIFNKTLYFIPFFFKQSPLRSSKQLGYYKWMRDGGKTGCGCGVGGVNDVYNGNVPNGCQVTSSYV